MLKGTATIELTNVKTGKKEIVKHDNLVTNAIQDLLTLNPLGMRFRKYANAANNTTNITQADMYHEMGDSFEAGMFPICPNAIGGILLYEDALEEDPAKYYAPMDNLLVGYSSNDVNTTTDDRRGSLNQTESGPLEDGSGYRFVFDFATSQANGTISALGLTSMRGGKAGYGAEEDKVGYPMLVVDMSDTNVEQACIQDDMWYARNNWVAVDVENNWIYYARMMSANRVAVGKLKFMVNSVGIMDEPSEIPQTVVSETMLTTTKFGAVASSSLSYMGYTRSYAFAGTFVDGDDGYIWGFQHKNNVSGNSSGKASVLWLKINKADFSFTEGEWELDAQLLPFGMSEYNEPGRYMIDYKKFKNNSIIKNGRLYALKYDQMGVYSINLENITDIQLMECDFAIDASFPHYVNVERSYPAFGTNVIEIGDVIAYKNAYINGGEIHKAGYGTTVRKGLQSYEKQSVNKAMEANSITRAHYGPFFLNYYYFYYSNGRNTYYYYYPVVWLMTSYLATINNLDKPVQKTADKTMKITYILREEA